MSRVVLDLDGRFTFFPEFLRFAADKADGFNASLIREIAAQIEEQQDRPVVGRCPEHALTHCEPCGWITR